MDTLMQKRANAARQNQKNGDEIKNPLNGAHEAVRERERPHEGQASNSSRGPIFNRCVTARFKLVPVRASQGLLPRGGDKAALLASCTFSIASIYFSRSSWLSVPVLETSNWSNCSMNGRKLSHESGCPHSSTPRTARQWQQETG